MRSTNSNENLFLPFQEKLERENANELIIRSFRRSYEMLLAGDTGKLTNEQIAPVETVASLEDLIVNAGENPELLRKVAIVKLNGGLGTSMGLDRAKSIIPVRDGLSFIDVIARQAQYTNQEFGIHIPVILMNSFITHEDTITALAPYQSLKSDIPFDFLQNKVPKVLAGALAPAVSDTHPDLEWCPPGHGDIYISMRSSGVLESLLRNGYEYAFISNSDNLGAVLDARILEYVAHSNIPFLMEVAARTKADRKGGHLAFLNDGRLTLRESAQCPDDEMDEFQDIGMYRFFNTNSLWVHLPSLEALMTRHDGILPLPLIKNRKTLDPRDPESPEVFQLETAMGAAISLFENSAALLVPRSRFAPVKTTNDLLAVRSDAYMLTDGYQVIPHPDRNEMALTIDLDMRYYKHIDDLERAFPHGVPSLFHCTSLSVRGLFVFGRNIIVQGGVALENGSQSPIRIADGTFLRNA